MTAGRATVAAHLDISTVALRRLVENKVIDDAEPGEMDIDAARIRLLCHAVSSRWLGVILP